MQTFYIVVCLSNCLNQQVTSSVDFLKPFLWKCFGSQIKKSNKKEIRKILKLLKLLLVQSSY